MMGEDIEFPKSFCFLETWLSPVTWIRPSSFQDIQGLCFGLFLNSP